MARTPHLKDLDELRTFVQVVDSGSMTAAGRVLGVPTNVVSRRLARLEERVGVPLAQRTTRRLRPTEEGRRLHARALRVLEELAAAEAELRGVGAGLAGELRLSVPSRIADLLRRPLHEFVREHEGLELRLFVTDRPANAVVGDIVEHGLDAAVLIGPVPPASIVTRRLGQLCSVLAASPAYLAARGRPRAPADLRKHECLPYVGERLQTEWLLHDARGREQTVAIRGRFASSDSRTLFHAMVDGLGIGLALPGDLTGPELVRVLPGWISSNFEVRLGYAAGRRGSARIDAVARLIASALGERGR